MYVIAEAGINFNGSLRIAKSLAYESKKAGADGVKFQTFWNMGRLEEYELKKEEWLELKSYCDKINIDFLSTPHTMEAIDFINPLVSIHKLASPYIINKEFVQHIGKTNKKILMSTGSLIHKNGMATIKEIKKTLGWLPKNEVTLLHCVSKYPCENPHYERIDELREIFKLPVGLSDHSKTIKFDISIPVLEKHIMLHGVKSIDENVSLYPEEFKMMVNNNE